MINLISDTVTQPCKSMLKAMMEAEVGDDVFGQDPTINALEAKLMDMFGMEAAVYCPSGTMTNQIAIRVHIGLLEELICDINSHVYQSETGGYAANSGAGVKLIHGTNGKITAEQVKMAINPDYDWVPKSKLVVLENTCNKGGGCYYTAEEIEPITALCKEEGLKLHLDGARIFNALIESGDKPQSMGRLFDSISVCLSKGLGAPVGSVLLGNKDFIKQARRCRKAMGGGMRQAGYLAAACIYALDHNIDRLKIDHDRAKLIAQKVAELPMVENIRPVHTNILIFDVKPPHTSASFIKKLEELGILAVPFGPQTVRFVTHLDFTEAMLDQVLTKLQMLQ